MWEFTKIFSSSDNLYKFLFVGGISMVFVALFYPLSKQHELELNKNNLEFEVELLSNETDLLKRKVENLRIYNKKVNSILDSLKLNFFETDSIQKKSINQRINSLSISYDSLYNKTEYLIQNSKISNIKLNYNVKKVQILSSHIITYRWYTYFLFFIGFVFGWIGLIGWGIATFKTDKIRNQQISKNQLELDAMEKK